LCAFLPGTADGAGLFEDFGESSSFILSPRFQSLAVSAARTESEGGDAFLYTLYASYAVKSAFLLQAEQSYVTISSPNGIRSGFGDFLARLRAGLYTGGARAVYFLSALRSGSGSRSIFPYASGSIDATAGFAYVDSLALFNYWGAAGATAVWRGPKAIDGNSVHDNYAVISAGVSFPLHDSFEVRVFGAGYFLTSGPIREIYGLLASYRASSFVSAFVSLQAEAGKEEERVTDAAVFAGVRIYYAQ
jgi:hypothetical protein